MDPQLLHRQNDGRKDRHGTGNIRISASVAAKAPEMEDVIYLYLRKDNITGLVLLICDLNKE